MVRGLRLFYKFTGVSLRKYGVPCMRRPPLHGHAGQSVSLNSQLAAWLLRGSRGGRGRAPEVAARRGVGRGPELPRGTFIQVKPYCTGWAHTHLHANHTEQEHKAQRLAVQKPETTTTSRAQLRSMAVTSGREGCTVARKRLGRKTGGLEAAEGRERSGRAGGRERVRSTRVDWDTRASTTVLVVHCGLRFCLRRRGLGVALDRVGAELRARNELCRRDRQRRMVSMQRAGRRGAGQL